ncbi:MAG: thioesterase family protein [Desulfobacula sp.]|jgi:thioesterase-3|nr:thioesterase family protein [Desulfobacula sp.]
MKTITNLTVRSYHIDHFGHVNHARYVELLEEARWQYLEKNKLLDPIHEVSAFHVVAELFIKYRKP